MRYKIHWSKTRTDRWGHILSSVSHVEYADVLEEAITRAQVISTEHKKYSVNVYDLEGPQLDDDISRTWLVVGYEKGIGIFNTEYFKELKK